MTIRSGFFKSVGGDRKYLAEFFTSYFGSFIGNGVFPNPSTNLQVVAGTNMTVNVRPGKGWINGYYLENDADFALTHIPANGTFNRIDRIVFAVNFDTRDMTIYIKQGANGATASPPALIRNSTVYELCLADVSIPAGTTTITQSLITDTRQNNELCGIVHGTVEQVDTTTLYNQYQTYLNEFQQSGTQQFQSFLTASQQEFDQFFQSLEENLSGDVAGNLQNQITALQNNTRKATQQEALAGTDNTTIMTPLRVDEANRFNSGTRSEDLNTYTNNGKHFFGSSQVPNLINAPALNAGYSCYLQVLNRTSNDVCSQILSQNGGGNVWIRSQYNASSNDFSPWQRLTNLEISTTAQVQSGTNNTTVITPLRLNEVISRVGLGNVTPLTPDSNLNNLNITGFFRVRADSVNAPITNSSHIISIIRSDSFATQILISDDNRMFYRSKNVTVWSSWKEVGDTGNLVNLSTSSKSNIVSSINEVFAIANEAKTQADNIKTRWASVVGSPLLSTDTQAQLETKTQTIKNNLASNITSKGVAASGTETLTALTNKVANINQGPRTASGTVTSSTSTLAFTSFTGNTTLNFPSVTVTGLGFTPRKIMLVATTGTIVREISYNAKERPTLVNNVITLIDYDTQGTSGITTIAAQNPASITNGGFVLPSITASTTYNWYAEE